MQHTGHVLLVVVLAAVWLSGAAGSAEPVGRTPGTEGRVLSTIPERPDPDARYVIYLDGAVAEGGAETPRHSLYGVYEGAAVHDTLAARGFTVLNEVRPRWTVVDEYAERVAAQIDTLIERGVPPERIGVVGFSKGGAIAVVTSSITGQTSISFGFLAACSPWVLAREDLVLKGRVLSIYDASDTVAESCSGLMVTQGDDLAWSEIELSTGDGHATFYRPDPVWIEPLVDWLNQGMAEAAAPPEGETAR